LTEAGTSASTAELAAGVEVEPDEPDDDDVEVARPDGGVFEAFVEVELLLPHPAIATAPISGTNNFHVRI
jgi:hypothetical protein